MIHMKRKLFFIFVIVFLVSLPACGTGSAPDVQASQTDGSSSSAEEGVVSDPSLPENGVAPEVEDPVQGTETYADVEIKDKLFVEQVNDIYLNLEDYEGKTIKYEGVFEIYEYEPPDRTFCYVVRYGPGCCAMDGIVGFEIVWDGDYPKFNDWVEVAGTVEPFHEQGFETVRMIATSLTKLPYRGDENVASPQ